MYNRPSSTSKTLKEHDAYILWSWKKHFIKNRYLHCNIINIWYAFPKVAMWSVHFPQRYKKKIKIDSSTQYDLLSIKEYVFVTDSKASTEN